MSSELAPFQTTHPSLLSGASKFKDGSFTQDSTQRDEAVAMVVCCPALLDLLVEAARILRKDTLSVKQQRSQILLLVLPTYEQALQSARLSHCAPIGVAGSDDNDPTDGSTVKSPIPPPPHQHRWLAGAILGQSLVKWCSSSLSRHNASSLRVELLGLVEDACKEFSAARSASQ